jgi:hypothetical protein
MNSETPTPTPNASATTNFIHQRAVDRAASHDVNARWYAEVAAVTTAEERAAVLHAHHVKFGQT